MLASIILERRGVLLYNSASVLPLRFVNNGPLSLLLALNNMFARAGLWSAVTLLLYCTTLLLQFTSTALVADIKIGKLTGAANRNTTLVGLSFKNLNQTAGRIETPRPYWSEPIKDFPMFAERREQYLAQDYSISGNLTNAVVDTGLTHRVFLPFVNEAERTSIQSFTGTATILDARVICVRPRMHRDYGIALMAKSTSDADSKTIDRWVLNGSISIDPDVAPPGLILAHKPVYLRLSDQGGDNFLVMDKNNYTRRVNFRDSQKILFGKSGNEWNLAKTNVYTGPRLVSSLDPRYLDILESKTSNISFDIEKSTGEPFYNLGDEKIPLMTGRAYQLMNITPVASYPTVANQPLVHGVEDTGFLFHTDPKRPEFYGKAEHLIVTPENEWLVFTMARIPGWRIATTLCFDSFASVDANVTLSTRNPAAEPRLAAWDVSKSTFGTEAVQKQLDGHQPQGGANQSYTKRGILTLETTPKQIQDQIRDIYMESKAQGLNYISFPAQNFVGEAINPQKFGTKFCTDCNLNILACSDCDNRTPGMWSLNADFMYYMQNNSRLHNQIFQDVIRNTKSPVQALQAYYTILARTAYYDVLPYFDITDTPLLSWFTDVPFPRASSGLIIVGFFLFLHIVVVVFIIISFLTQTIVSRTGDNAWQSLAQTRSNEMEDIIQAGFMSKDDEVKKWLSLKGIAENIVYLGWIRDPPNESVGLKRD